MGGPNDFRLGYEVTPPHNSTTSAELQSAYDAYSDMDSANTAPKAAIEGFGLTALGHASPYQMGEGTYAVPETSPIDPEQLRAEQLKIISGNIVAFRKNLQELPADEARGKLAA